MKKSLTVLALLLFAVLAGIGYALTPPPPPPPPVPQNLAIFDSSIDTFHTNATDQSACRACHQSTGTNISGGYNNSAVGGVPTRHHSLVARASQGVVNPFTNAPFQCQDCHPSTLGTGVLLDRSCTDCHNATNFWADSALGAKVGNISRPHHVNTTYDDANIGNPAAARQCNFCHGSFVNNYNDSHYKPTYATDFMITPFANWKATNLSQPLSTLLFDAGGDQVLDKTWGGCESCHLGTLNNNNTQGSVSVAIGNNHNNHHREILGGIVFDNSSGSVAINLGNATPFDVSASPWSNTPRGPRVCFVCHVINTSSPTGSPLIFSTTNSFTGEVLDSAMEVRNSTIEAASTIEPGTTNITFNGTGCEKCHGVSSIHNIQFNYQQNGPQGLGHINNNTDCYGCHNSWLPADTWVPGALVPYVDSISPSVIGAGTATTLTITGSNFVNGAYTSVVSIDGVQYTPKSISDAQIVVDIPALTAGTHQLQLVKGGDTLSKLSTLTVVPTVTLSSATLSGGTLTITGSGLGSRPTTNAQQYVLFSHAGSVYYSDSITSWSDTQIVATLSGTVTTGDTVEVITANSGQAVSSIVVAGSNPTTVIVTSPNGGEIWKRGTTHAITWTSVGITGNVKIELLRGTSTGTLVSTIVRSTNNSGTYNWNIPKGQTIANNYKVRITSIGTNPLYTDTSDSTFQIVK